MLRRARMLVLLAAVAATALPARAHALAVTHIEGMLSTVFQSEQSSFSGIGLRVHLETPRLLPGITIIPVMEYWRNTNRLDAFNIKSSQTDATLGAEGRYTFKRQGIQPYLGAGWGVHFLSSEVHAPDIALNRSDSVTKGGFSLLGGFDMPISGKLSNVFEVKFHYLPGDSQTKLNYGLSWKL